MSAATHGMHGLMCRLSPGDSPVVRRSLKKAAILALLATILTPILLFTTPAGKAFADDKDNKKNYSLYHLASNASSYFSAKNSPDNDGKGLNDDWKKVTRSPADGGALLGYADPSFSLSNVVGWFFASISGSSETVSYETLQSTGDDGKSATGAKNDFRGMLDYAHYGATLSNLGLDSMSSGIGGDLSHLIMGSLFWGAYALALSVSVLFWLVLQILKMLNPFLLFGPAWAQISPVLAQGMTDGNMVPGPLAGLAHFVSTWYVKLNTMAWEGLVPLFIGFTLFALVMFKKLDKGKLLKKLLIRMVFIGVGLPILGGLYTSTLNSMSDSIMGSSSGPTQVVLSTYVDFDAWVNNDRLAVPDQAAIEWSNGGASNNATMSVRNTSKAINKLAHPSAYKGISVDANLGGGSANDAWKNNSVGAATSKDDDATSVSTTFGILTKYLTSQTSSASDFESDIKTSISNIKKSDIDKDKYGEKKDWFVTKDTYGDDKDFGDQKGKNPKPQDHPVISTLSQGGLTSSSPGGSTTTFTTPGAKSCGSTVWKDGAPASCNLSPLAAYNYLNTGFDSGSLTMYSSNNAMSGFTRENHMAVSQVGTGPAKYMYWFNGFVILMCLTLLGYWYGFGMLSGAIKRQFSLIAAVPFATMGAIAGIAKVIIYTVAMILEILATFFLYQFVGEFLISFSDIFAGPVSKLMTGHGLFSNALIGGIVVIVFTLISTIMTIGVTMSLLKVRKQVIQALEEAVTKLVDKFLETNTPPSPNKGGMMPALASGLGAGAGMAAGNKLASGIGNKLGGNKGPGRGPGGKGPGGKSRPSNAGGGNGPQQRMLGQGQQKALPGGTGDPSGDPSGGGGINLAKDGGPGAGVGNSHDSSDSSSEAMALPGHGPGSSRSDREKAAEVAGNGGLSDRGFNMTGKPGSVNTMTGGSSRFSPGSTGSGTEAKTGGTGGSSNSVAGAVGALAAGKLGKKGSGRGGSDGAQGEARKHGSVKDAGSSLARRGGTSTGAGANAQARGSADKAGSGKPRFSPNGRAGNSTPSTPKSVAEQAKQALGRAGGRGSGGSATGGRPSAPTVGGGQTAQGSTKRFNSRGTQPKPAAGKPSTMNRVQAGAKAAKVTSKAGPVAGAAGAAYGAATAKPGGKVGRPHMPSGSKPAVQGSSAKPKSAPKSPKPRNTGGSSK